jgi:four helix bundle protein
VSRFAEEAGVDSKIRNFRDLEVWQLGKRIVMRVYETTRAFPREEQFGLISQMRRAAVSIPSNIAEGFNRYNNREYRHFLYIALGSCAEIETQIEVSGDLRYIDDTARDELLEQIDFESRMLRNLIKKLEERVKRRS